MIIFVIKMKRTRKISKFAEKMLNGGVCFTKIIHHLRGSLHDLKIRCSINNKQG